MNPLDLLLLALMAVAFWLLILRPAKVRRQAQAKLVASLAPGKRVMTAGGIFGTLVGVDSNRVRLEVAPGMVLELLPQAIAEVLPDAEVDAPPVAGALDAPTDPALAAPTDPGPGPTPRATTGGDPADPDAPAGAPTSREADRG
ncbi:MAG TPA: preprotein translocase subunit YajC [Candidatus Nanopelagicales bacterium]